MAGGGGQNGRKAFNRYLKQDGGWTGILDRYAAGETVNLIAASLRAPFQAWAKAQGIEVRPSMPSDKWLYMQLGHPRLRDAYKAAQAMKAHVYADRAEEMVEHAVADRDSIQLARLKSEFYMKRAALLNREEYGETPAQTNVNVLSTGKLHLLAISDPTLVEAARAAFEAKHQRALPVPNIDGGEDAA